MLDWVEVGRVRRQSQQGAAFGRQDRAQLVLPVEGGVVQDDDLPFLQMGQQLCSPHDSTKVAQQVPRKVRGAGNLRVWFAQPDCIHQAFLRLQICLICLAKTTFC